MIRCEYYGTCGVQVIYGCPENKEECDERVAFSKLEGEIKNEHKI